VVVPRWWALLLRSPVGILTLPFRLKIPVATLAIGLVALWAFFHFEARAGIESSAIVQQAHQVLIAGKAYRAHLVRAQQEAATRIVTVHIRDTVVVRLAGQLQADTAARDSARTLLAIRDTLMAQRDSLVSAVRFLTARAELAEIRASALESNLKATLTVADCHIAGFKWLPRCPSRSMSFLIGATGASLALLATHH